MRHSTLKQRNTIRTINKVIPDRKLGEYMLEYNKQDYVKEKKKITTPQEKNIKENVMILKN